MVFGFRKVRYLNHGTGETVRLSEAGGVGWGGGRGGGTTVTSIQKVEQTALLCHQSLTSHTTNVCLTPRFDFNSRLHIHTEMRFSRVKTSIIVYLLSYMTYSTNTLLICKVCVGKFFRDSENRSSQM
jgi:hypothetical protein